ncbi:hypothetical protein CHS0354_026166 [Potamilus streckersoni]|uniref:EF-hand domain-containing protein n=1 Tax=Potamilus streckersoni TaxID=2493646 RepID=A0AAE0SAZ0_9BIVA|nr:hypothetical protein CHS0354_026166 [Potamilus streckersoni]
MNPNVANQTSQSGRQQFHKECGIPRMVQYPQVCTEGSDLRHCEIRSVFYHPVSESGITTWVPEAPCETDQKSLLTLGDFAVFDKDGSGFVDTRELITASRVVDEADGLFSTSDLNKDGFMDMCEFSKFPGSWKKILDKIRYFYSLYNIPENTFGCIEFISSFSSVQEANNITDTPFLGTMIKKHTSINMLRGEDQTVKAKLMIKPSTEGVPRFQFGDQLITDASDNMTRQLFALYTATSPTKGTTELQYGMHLTTVTSAGRRKSHSVTETGTFLTRLGIHLTTHASGRTQTLSSFADNRDGDAVEETRSNIRNMKMTTEAASKTSQWHFDDLQWLSTMPTGTLLDTTKTDVSPATEVNIRDTQETATKTYFIDSGTTQIKNTSGIYTEMNATSESYSNDILTWSTELPMTSTLTPEIKVKQMSKVSSKEKTDDTKIHDSDNILTSQVAFFTNQRDEYIQDTKTTPDPNEYQGTTSTETTERFENGVPETEIKRKEKTNQFQHMTDIMTNSPIIPTTVSYEHITGYMAHSTNDLITNELIEINTSTEIPNKKSHSIISNQYNMAPEDDRSAITNFPIQPELPITYEGKENLTQEHFNSSKTIYSSMEKKTLDRHSLQVGHTSVSWSVSTKRTVHGDQLDVVNRDHIYKSKALDEEDLSRKNKRKIPYLKTEPHYLDRDSSDAQRKMMNGMKAISVYNMHWIQRHDQPGFPYRNRSPFMTYTQPQLNTMGVLLHSPHMISFTRDREKPSFATEIQNKQVSIIPAMHGSPTGVGIRDHVKGTYGKNLELQTSAVDKSNQHLIDQAVRQGIKDHPHAINKIKSTNLFANSFFSKAIEKGKDGFPRPKKHEVQERVIYNSTRSSSTGKYISKTFPNIMTAPKKTREKRKEEVSEEARSRLNIKVQQKIPQPKKGLQKMVTLKPKPKLSKSFEFDNWKNGDNSAEEFSYSDIEVDSDERSD